MSTWRAARFASAIVVACLACAGVVAAPASAEKDSTPPAITITAPRYLVGSSLSTFYFNFVTNTGCTPGPLKANCLLADVAQSMWFRWRASDPSGICSQAITEQSYNTLGGAPDPVLGGDTDTFPVRPGVRRHSYSTSIEDNLRVPTRFVVRPTDCAGNTATSAIVTTFNTWVNEDTGNRSPVVYVNRWTTRHSSAASGSTTHGTVVAGASASFTASGGAVGLVMGKAPDHGFADIYLDGVRTAAVDTYSATARDRQVVWETMLPAGGAAHIVKIVNRATAGRPRIDVDALMYCVNSPDDGCPPP